MINPKTIMPKAIWIRKITEFTPGGLEKLAALIRNINKGLQTYQSFVGQERNMFKEIRLTEIDGDLAVVIRCKTDTRVTRRCAADDVHWSALEPKDRGELPEITIPRPEINLPGPAEKVQDTETQTISSTSRSSHIEIEMTPPKPKPKRGGGLKAYRELQKTARELGIDPKQKKAALEKAIWTQSKAKDDHEEPRNKVWRSVP